MANISAIKYARFSLPESLQSRVTQVLGFAGAGYGSSEVEETRHGYVQLGAQKVGQVASLLVTVANHPGEVDNNMIRSIDRGCFEVTAVGPVSSKDDGTREFMLDGMFDFDRSRCQPKIVIGECGVADERFHSREFPVRFDRVTTVYTNTVDIASNFTAVEPPDQSGCEGLVERDGDLNFKTESSGPGPMACGLSLKVDFDDAVSEKWKMVFKAGSSGQCGLGSEFMTDLIDFAKDNHPLFRMYSGILNRQSDYHWAYDTLPPFQLGRSDLDKELARPHYVVQHFCGVAGGWVRTWIDKAIHTQFIRETVNTVQP